MLWFHTWMLPPQTECEYVKDKVAGILQYKRPCLLSENVLQRFLVEDPKDSTSRRRQSQCGSQGLEDHMEGIRFMQVYNLSCLLYLSQGDVTKAKPLRKYAKEEEKSCKTDFPNNFPGQRVELLSITLFHEQITASSSHLPNFLHLQFSTCLGTWGQTTFCFLLLHVTF